MSKYEKIYSAERHALGKPTQAFVDFFNQQERSNLSVLDLGCGQGRDALFIARLGHSVLGVDLSPTGIAQLNDDAEKEGLEIKALVADLTQYQPTGEYDIVVINRTLHMLEPSERLDVLRRVVPHMTRNGFVLIADERKNLPAIRDFFANQSGEWQIVKESRGLLFMLKQS
jgi:2-polyprenyl-3-methyl-5-hydroxy-6-metoxy-1,4-benzoquinol methylase